MTVPPALSRQSVTDYVRQVPWLMQVPVHGRTFGEHLEEQPRFAIQGEGKLSERRIVAETKAGRDLLTGPLGPKLERSLRGLLATNDAMSGATELFGIAFSTSPAGTAVNIALGEMLVDGFGVELPPPTPTAGLPGALTTHLEAVAAQRSQGLSAYSTPYMVFNDKASAGLFDMIENGRLDKPIPDSGMSAKRQGDFLGSLGVHELQHRTTPPDLANAQRRSISAAGPAGALLSSRAQLAEEGTVDLIAHLPGVIGPAMERMGFQSNGTKSFGDGYEPLVRTWRHVLNSAGLDPDDANDSTAIHTLLQGAPSEGIYRVAAEAIAQHHKLEAKQIPRIERAITRIGESGIDAGDYARADELDTFIAQRTGQFLDLMDKLGAGASQPA